MVMALSCCDSCSICNMYKEDTKRIQRLCMQQYTQPNQEQTCSKLAGKGSVLLMQVGAALV